MTTQGTVICLGIMVADLIGWPTEALPAAGELTLVDNMQLHTGGCAVNTATILADLQIPVKIIGRVGDDPLGDFLIESLRVCGVNTKQVVRSATSNTSATMVMVEPDGERRFVHYLGANAQLTLADVDMQQIRQAAMLHVAGSLVLPGLDGAPTAALLREAQEAGVSTFLDTVWDATGRWITLLESALPYIDYFVPNLPEARALTGRDNPKEVARALIDHGVKTVIIKMADQGCYLMNAAGQHLHVPAFDVQAVDTTGAGDAFAAGFIAGIWHGWPLEKTVRFANAVGALSVTGSSARGNIRSLNEILSFMHNTPRRV